jgi:hypothetical protein
MRRRRSGRAIVNGERLPVAGSCIVCRKQTESVVQFDANDTAFLCPPCGQSLREEETSVCLCGAPMKDGKCSVEGCVASA